MPDKLRQALYDGKSYEKLLQQSNQRTFTFHHHIPKDELAALGEMIFTFSNRQTVNFTTGLKVLIKQWLENECCDYDLDSYIKKPDTLDSLVKTLRMLPCNIYAGHMFNNGNPGNNFDAGPADGTLENLHYIPLLRNLQIQMRNIPCAKQNYDDQGKTWEKYLDKLLGLIKKLNNVWWEECNGHLYFNENIWLWHYTQKEGYVEENRVVRADNNYDYPFKLFYAKQFGQHYITRDDIDKARNNCTDLSDAAEQMIQELIKIKYECTRTYNIDTGDKKTFIFTLDLSEVQPRHIVDRHSFFGTPTYKSINSFFHKKDGQHTPQIFGNNCRMALESLLEDMANHTIANAGRVLTWQPHEDFHGRLGHQKKEIKYGDYGAQGSICCCPLNEHEYQVIMEIVSFYPIKGFLEKDSDENETFCQETVITQIALKNKHKEQERAKLNETNIKKK